jgi:hypothetical protein
MISIQISNNTKRNLDFINTHIPNHNVSNDNNIVNTSKMLYYETLMQNTISKTIINKLSLDNFIQYNFNILFPVGYYYIILQNKITFYNNTNNIITYCFIHI